MKAELSKDGNTIVVTIPMNFRRRGGRTTIVAPEGMEMPKTPRDDSLVKLLVKAHRWLRLIESGNFASIKDLAEHERIDGSYVARVLRLTLLAPDIKEAILDDKHPDMLTVRELAKPFPVLWEEQRVMWGMASVPFQDV
ncbi:MAG: hypothetical protein HQL74_16280 [Magnetococcales bacterium]|nr:hypothetical protein [Magnetococcales bacterium]